MRFDVPREGWQSPRQPVAGPAFPGWGAIKRIVIHGTGVPTLNPNDPPAVLRSTQNYYLTSRGYSIGYNGSAAVDGKSYELRGDDFQCAANVNYNSSSFALLLLIPSGQPAPPAVLDAARRVIAEVRVLAGWDVPCVPHSSIGATDCPNQPVRTQLAAGAFEPQVELPTPVLKLGDRGDRVAVLRDHLVFWKMATKPGRIFTPATRLAVKRWQRSLKVPETGRYDVATFDAYKRQVGQ